MNVRRFTPENDSGAGLAATAPPSQLASQVVGGDAIERIGEESDAADLELKFEFRRKLEGLRWLPRKARAGARRELYEWLRAARKALRDRKAVERRAELELRRKKLSESRPKRSPASSGPAI